MNTTREQRFAAEIDRLRQQYPKLDDSYWAGMKREQRLRWQLDDLHAGIQDLAARYRWHAEQDPTNRRLAALVAELAALIDQPAPAQGVER